MNENLYMFLLDYKGGTYIKQVRALPTEQACDIWLESLDYSLLKGFGIIAILNFALYGKSRES